jgi:hypothetical protein
MCDQQLIAEGRHVTIHSCGTVVCKMCINCPQAAWDLEKFLLLSPKQLGELCQTTCVAGLPIIFHALLQ